MACHESGALSGQGDLFHAGSVARQRVPDLTCYAGIAWMRARREHLQHVEVPSIRVKLRGTVRASIQEHGDDLRGISRNHLATDLDAVGSRVVQQGGAVTVGRPASRQIWVVCKQIV